MERLTLEESTIQEAASRAATVLKAGGVVLYPTDTLYGLGADAFSDEAVAKIFRIKGRDEGKPVHAIVDGIDMATQYGELSDDVELLVEELPRGKVTFIVPKHAGIESGITKGISTFGFRIPDNSFCIEMVRVFGKPVTATSANIAGEKTQLSVDAILAQLGDAARHIDLVIDAGELPPQKASSVIDLSGPEPEILREGTVPASHIRAILGR